MISTIFLATTVQSSPVSTQSIDLVRIAESVTPSIIKIICTTSEGSDASGTGFFVSKIGLVVSCWHLLDGATNVRVHSLDGSNYVFDEVLAVDYENDLVLLQVQATDAPTLITSVEDPVQGQRIVVVGNPLGLDGTLSEGIVSAIRDNTNGFPQLQITAPVSPGSSGSPVVDAGGDVIGVVVSTVTEGQAINFAVTGKVLGKFLLNWQQMQPNKAAASKPAGSHRPLAKDGWNTTKWGMSIADIRKLFPDTLYEFNDEDRIPEADGLSIGAYLKDYEIAGTKWKVAFLFDDTHDVLSAVKIQPESQNLTAQDKRALTKDLKNRLINKYGTPTQYKDDPKYGAHITWRSQTTSISLNSTYFIADYKDIRAGQILGIDIAGIATETASHITILYRWIENEATGL